MDTALSGRTPVIETCLMLTFPGQDSKNSSYNKNSKRRPAGRLFAVRKSILDLEVC
jgi:hypothetical protein